MRPCHATLAPGCQDGVIQVVGAGACHTRRCEAFLRARQVSVLVPSFPLECWSPGCGGRDQPLHGNAWASAIWVNVLAG